MFSRRRDNYILLLLLLLLLLFWGIVYSGGGLETGDPQGNLAEMVLPSFVIKKSNQKPLRRGRAEDPEFSVQLGFEYMGF